MSTAPDNHGISTTPPKPVDPATCSFTPDYELKNASNNPFIPKGKKRLSRQPLQYNFPPEAFQNTFGPGGLLITCDKRSEWLNRYGLAPPTYAYRVSIQTKSKVDGKTKLTMTPAYECWAVDESEAILFAFKTYNLVPTDCIYSAIRVDIGF